MLTFRTWAGAMSHAALRAHDTGIRQRVEKSLLHAILLRESVWIVRDADHQRRARHA
jgi:hypothetical protein